MASKSRESVSCASGVTRPEAASDADGEPDGEAAGTVVAEAVAARIPA